MSIIEPGDIDKAKAVFRDKPKGDDGKISGSTSYLQRKMQWGYNHAAAVIEHLVTEAWLTEPDHVGRRTVVGMDEDGRVKPLGHDDAEFGMKP